MWIIRLLKKWHVLHTWDRWIFDRKECLSYAWTPAGYYNEVHECWHRNCEVCGKPQYKMVVAS